MSTSEMATFADHTTVRVGGPARHWAVATTEQQIIDEVRAADAAGTAVLILGGGSNLVVADRGFDGLVVQIATAGIGYSEHDGAVSLVAEAGEPWDGLVSYAVDHGWAGIEALSGVPGLVGATPIQNVGAYGQDVSQVLTSVRAWDRRRNDVVELSNSDCEFAYRSSAFKVDPARWVILRVTLRLVPARANTVAYAELARTLDVELGDHANIDDIRAAVLLLRRGKGMVLDATDHDTWSTGSYFTNPIVEESLAATVSHACPRYPADRGVKLSAAWLIEQAGIDKGFCVGPNASVSTKHTLALTNRGQASAADIVALADAIRRRVREAHGIELQVEPVLVGF